MTKRNNYHRSQLDRIESKIDRLLSELLIIRHGLIKKDNTLDAVIERMHAAAKRLRHQSEVERDAAFMFIRRGER